MTNTNPEKKIIGGYEEKPKQGYEEKPKQGYKSEASGYAEPNPEENSGGYRVNRHSGYETPEEPDKTGENQPFEEDDEKAA